MVPVQPGGGGRAAAAEGATLVQCSTRSQFVRWPFGGTRSPVPALDQCCDALSKSSPRKYGLGRIAFLLQPLRGHRNGPVDMTESKNMAGPLFWPPHLRWSQVPGPNSRVCFPSSPALLAAGRGEDAVQCFSLVSPYSSKKALRFLHAQSNTEAPVASDTPPPSFQA